MNSIYIYCISEKLDELMLTVINSLPIKMMQYNELCIIYSSINKEIKYIEENFFAHENVLEELLKKDVTILPFRFGTYIDEEDGKTILKEKYNIFFENINFLKGRVEISVRAIWNYNSVLKKVKNNFIAPQIGIPNEKIKNYLNKKMEDYKLKECISQYAAIEAEKIHKLILDNDFEGKYILMKTDSMFFNASYLVKKNKINDFSSKIQFVVSDFAEYKFLVTGPWPPYNFCNLLI